jgi:L-asparaginase/Glu-tRNA(Gln) amidotransferase subunit D
LPDLRERPLKTVPSSYEEGIFSFEEQELTTMQKKSIYVAYTGGTIGMQRSENGYIPVSGHLQRQLALMPEFHRPEMPDFTIHEYEPLMDSSDMTPEDWQHIADDIKAHYDQYDGFVILHGTDTMAFTASALSFMLENLSKPVIVTGSQIPLAELRSDGQINLLNSLYVAANYPINEVSCSLTTVCIAATAPPKPTPTALTPLPHPTCSRCWRPGFISVVWAPACAEHRGRADCASDYSATDWRGDHLSGYLCGRGA